MMQSNEVSPSLLDKLDQAYAAYLQDEEERLQGFRFDKESVVSGVRSAKNFIFGGGNEDPNFSNRLIDLQLNWSESLDNLDQLLAIHIPGLVSLSLDADNSSKLNHKYKMYTMPI